MGWEADRRRGHQAEPQGAGGKRMASTIAPVGARTQWEVGGPPPEDAVEVRAPAGVIAYEPADMTVTVGAGTPFDELDDVLREHGQEVPLDPRARTGTIGW